MHDKELHRVYTSPHVVEMNKSRRVRWAGHVARRGIELLVKMLIRKPKGRRLLIKYRREKRTMNCLREIGFGLRIGFIWLRV
jgi:hypothetical protein